MSVTVLPSVGERLRASVARLILLTFTLAALVVGVVTSLGIPILVRLGPIRFTSQGPMRSIAFGALCAAALAIAGRRSRIWRALALTSVVIFAVLAYIAGHPATAFPVGDGALIELYAFHATHGHQLLGAYSQYGWHHPGPLVFYWLAPFYWVGQQSTHGLNVGVLAANLIALAIALRVVVRYADRLVALPVVLSALVVVFIARVPAFMVSAWNPHTPILPLLALLTVTAASLSGVTTLLPIALVLASYTIQTHVGFGVVTVVLCAVTVVSVLWRDWRQRDGGVTLRRRLLTAFFLMQALWLLPIAEQLARTPGNMTLLVRFFSDGGWQPIGLSWRVWGTMLAGAFDPDLYLALGGRWREPRTLALAYASMAIVVLLIPVAMAAMRRGQRFLAGIAIASFLASAAGFYSILKIRGVIGDYHVFWLAVIGIVNVAVLAGWLLSSVSQRLPARAGGLVAHASVIAAFVFAAALPGWQMWNSPPGARLGFNSSQVQGLMEGWAQVDRETAERTTVVRLGYNMWSAGAGVVLQMLRAGHVVTVAPEMIWMYGDTLAATGREDQLLLVSPTTEHLELMKKPGFKNVGYSTGVFLDLVNLHDYPEYRP